MKTVLAIAAAALLTACGTLVNDKPRANFSVDMNQCVAEAERAIPVVYGTHFGPGTSQQNCVRIGVTMQCNGTNTPAQVVSDGTDQNLNLRIG